MLRSVFSFFLFSWNLIKISKNKNVNNNNNKQNNKNNTNKNNDKKKDPTPEELENELNNYFGEERQIKNLDADLDTYMAMSPGDQ